MKSTAIRVTQQTDSQRIADRQAKAGDLLEYQGSNPFGVAAYRKPAVTVCTLGPDLETRFTDEGPDGLTRLPGIGDTLTRAIAEMLHTGRWAMLGHLRGTSDPEQLFRSIPGVGSKLAEQIRRILGIDSLDDLDMACRDGRLQSLPGFGARRAAMLRTALGERLSRTRQRSAASRSNAEPDVDVLLYVDREYRDKAKRGLLRLIAPWRFNRLGRGLAANPAHRTEGLAFHCIVFEHGSGPLSEANGGLGGDLFPQ